MALASIGRSIAVLLALAALAAPGCGGDDDDESDPGGGAPATTAPAPAPPASGGTAEDAVRTTMTTYMNAVAEGDGATACAQLTERGKRVAAQAQGAQADTCEGVIAEVAKLFRDEDRARLRDVGPEDVDAKVTGDSATAEVAGAKTTAGLVRRGDRWLIDSYGTTGAGPADDEREPPSPRSVAWNRVEEELNEVMERRYARATFECPPRANMRVGDAVECTVEADGRRGTMKVTFMKDAFLGYEIRLGGRISYGRSQITP